MKKNLELNNNQIEMLRFFCLKLIPDFNNEYFNMPFLKFVFNKSDLEKIIYYLKIMELSDGEVRLNIGIHLDKRSICSTTIDEVINMLNTLREEYENNHDDSIYIYVRDYKEFFGLLEDIKDAFEDKSVQNNFSTTALLRTIWLRMNVTDIENVLIFLKRQLAFIKNDFLFNTFETDFLNYEEISVSYLNHGNLAWFETNRHIIFFLKRKNKEILDGASSSYLYYSLPVIHYALIKEDGKPTCYIYGIQNTNNYRKDNLVKCLIQNERKHLRNKDVSPDFIIALNLFIKLLQSKGITCIKVPLLQVFNYTYHQQLGKKYKKRLDGLNGSLKDNSFIDQIDEYKNAKELCDEYYQKEDLISKNKTERLISTFALVRDYYQSLEFMSNPFIESDTLICSITEKCKKL